MKTASEAQCLNVEEQVVVGSEVLVHGGDLITPSVSDIELLIPLPTCNGNVLHDEPQSVAIVEAGQVTKTLVWAYGRPAFYVSPATAAVLSSVPTAVVAPIKRETAESVSVCQSLAGSTLQQSTSVLTPPLSKAHLPPFETFRAHASISVTSSTGEASPAAVNLSLETRSTTKSEQLPLTSVYRHPSSATLPYPVWSLPTVRQPAEVGTRPHHAADPQSSATDQLIASRDATSPVHNS